MREMDTLAKRLIYARDKAGLTQIEVAKLSGVKQSDLSKLERGESKKSTGMVGLARALKCNPFWLDDGKGDPYAAPGWPYELLNQNDYALIDESYRRRTENDLYAEAQRAKLKIGNGK